MGFGFIVSAEEGYAYVYGAPNSIANKSRHQNLAPAATSSRVTYGEMALVSILLF